MMTSPSALEPFHPLLRGWFEHRIGPPTDIQRRAWPHIAAGDHVLLLAPTGSGKTLAAFLAVLDRLISGAWPPDATHVLYVSPLKALNNDIQRNLLSPLAELENVFRQAGVPWPAIRVLTRSGDTPAAERRRQILRPPEILITTPETLNLMLASSAGPVVFPHLKTVILDEIHAVAGIKRGVHLITAVERLVPLAGEFQRIALSATVEPPEPIARFVGGRRLVSAGPDPRFEARSVHVLRSTDRKACEIRVAAPPLELETRPEPAGGDNWWALVARRLKAIIAESRSTLIFVNNRRLCERMAALLNDGEPRPLVYAHHGSLSQEARLTVEQRLKAGELPAIVSTASLELGIDIGALDRVVLLGTPPSISSALQRVGRAGHGVGGVSRATLFPTHPRDFVDAAVLARAVEEFDIEPLTPVRAPLDLLAQIVVAMTGAAPLGVSDLHATLRTADPYGDLSLERLEGVLAMLSGHFEGERMRSYAPLVSWNPGDGIVSAHRAALRQVWVSGGSIPDRGYFALRQADTRNRIGELDEEFVWECRAGETFTLGAQAWTIREITDNDVLVAPGDPRNAMAPFWKAEERSRDVHLSGRIAGFLEEVEARMEAKDFDGWLAVQGRLEPDAAKYLVRFLRLQRRLTRSELPHRHHVLAEWAPVHAGDRKSVQLILHLPWGGRVNRPLALALAAFWEQQDGAPIQSFANNEGIALLLPGRGSAADLLRGLPVESIETLLRRTLESSGLFGAHFREAAARALLLPRSDPRRRMPLWLSRVRAKKLFQAVARHPDFPLLIEAWRSCLQDEFDLPRLREMLFELRDGALRLTEIDVPEPSPFAEGLVWRETNALMYAGDETETGPSRLRPDLIEEVAFTPSLRPRLPRALLETFGRKLHRVFPEYAPRPGRDQVDWVAQRLWIAAGEWQELLDAIARDHPDEPPSGPELEAGLLWIMSPRLRTPGVIAKQTLAELVRALGETARDLRLAPFSPASPSGAVLPFESLPASALAQLRIGEAPGPSASENPALPPLAYWLSTWLSFHGPVPRSFAAEALGQDPSAVQPALEALAQARMIVEGRLSEAADEDEVCDAENYERLLRLARREAAPSFEPLPVERLPLFIAAQQGLCSPASGIEGLQDRLEPLLGFPLPAPLLERDLLPARVADYSSSWLDSVVQDSDLIWFGEGRERIVFCFEDQLDLLRTAAEEGAEPPDSETQPPDDRDIAPARHTYAELQRASGLPPSRYASRHWDAVWNGQLIGESAAALRRGVMSDFKSSTPDPQAEHATGRPGVRRRWRSSDPYPGTWRPLSPPAPPADALDELDRQKDRVRLLLDRYGLLFRDLLAHEAPAFRWAVLFRTMRLMELSGELLAGHFFEGIDGLQFMTPAGLERLKRPLPEDAVYWMNACDPASLCGVALKGLPARLPARRPTTQLVFAGSRLALISRKRGRDLQFRIPPDSPLLPEALAPFRSALSRSFDPAPNIAVETINGVAAPESPYLPALQAGLQVSLEPRRLLLWRRFD